MEVSESVDALEELDTDVSELEVVLLKNVELELSTLCVLVLLDDSEVNELELTLDSDVELDELVTDTSVEEDSLELVVLLKKVLELVTVELLLKLVLLELELLDNDDDDFGLVDEESTFRQISKSSPTQNGSKKPPDGVPVNSILER